MPSCCFSVGLILLSHLSVHQDQKIPYRRNPPTRAHQFIKRHLNWECSATERESVFMRCTIHTSSGAQTCKGCPGANQKKARRAGCSSGVGHLPHLHVALGGGPNTPETKERKLRPSWATQGGPASKQKLERAGDRLSCRAPLGLIFRTKTKTKPTQGSQQCLRGSPSLREGPGCHLSLVPCEKTE